MLRSSGAALSQDGLYRYQLSRCWDPRKRIMVFIMLNPSTADARNDDPTIRRCMGFARDNDCGGINVINLYAWRATKPADLKLAGDPIGPGNDKIIRYQLDVANITEGPVVAAWGAHTGLEERVAFLTEAAQEAGVPLWCLGTTKSGAPRHPLYVKADTPLTQWVDEVTTGR